MGLGVFPIIEDTMINHGKCSLVYIVGVVISMFDFHRSAQGSNPGRKSSKCLLDFAKTHISYRP